MAYKTKICQRCGKEYEPTSSIQKYCKECVYDARREYDAKRYKANPKKHLEYSSKYRKANPEKISKGFAKWQKVNLEACALNKAKRRSLKYANTPTDELLTLAQWHDVLALYNGHCAYCGKKTERLTLDHVRPLSKGGKHSKDNVVPACFHCNSSKGAHTPEERFGMGVAR